MINENLNMVNSVLSVRASGLQRSVASDLQQPQGKSISELLNEQKTEQKTQTDSSTRTAE